MSIAVRRESTVPAAYRAAVEAAPSSITPGLVRADLPPDGAAFLTGMTINRPWRVRSWLPVARAMTRMLASIAQDPDSAVLNSRTWMSGRTLMVMQHWRSHEELGRFASDPDHPHAAAMRDFNRRLAGTGDVGVWHETYTVTPELVESLYGNMPPLSLTAAYGAVPLRQARDGGATGRVRGGSGGHDLGQ